VCSACFKKVADNPNASNAEQHDFSKLSHEGVGEVSYKTFGESVNSITGKTDPY
jgi:hypothetical protein